MTFQSKEAFRSAGEMTARQLLESQRDALLAATSPSSPSWAVAQAARMLSRINQRLRDYTDHGLETDRGQFGPNGWQPAVDDIVSSLRWVPSRRVA